MTPEEELWMIVERVQPETLFVCGDTAERVGNRWQEASGDAAILTRVEMTEIGENWSPSGLHQLAVITETLEHLTEVEGEIFLGQLRNFAATRIAVIVADDSAIWNFNRLISLGFQRYRHRKVAGHTLYTYDLETYNPKREWNSPEHWANPENWGKYRW